MRVYVNERKSAAVMISERISDRMWTEGANNEFCRHLNAKAGGPTGRLEQRNRYQPVC
ncbi:MAG: hypothetical protein L0Z50_32400 [Verrucomicrobiales bacterium]|nr:hypothetical protein [Verrucomicrobiales bacterium]